MTDSIYDQLNAYSTVAKQRFVETFSGDALDTDRWSTAVVGDGTVTMSDSVDGGIVLNSGSNAVNQTTSIAFDGKRPFSATGCMFLCVAKLNGTTDQVTYIGMSNGATGVSGHNMTYQKGLSGSTWLATTYDGSTWAEANSTVTVDTSAHLFQIEGSASSTTFSIDGVVTNVIDSGTPTAALSPNLQIQNRNSSTARSLNSSYMECYNT
jgi:hypothetical protein